MAIITIISDWGTRDHYAAVIHGKIYSLLNDARVVDISHDISPFNLHQAAFVLKNAYSAFPKGTIHIIGLNTIENLDCPHTVIKFDGHYFIGADNGIFSLICNGQQTEAFTITIDADADSYIFATRDVFVKVAAHIVAGKKISELGAKRPELNQLVQFEPIVHDNLIKGLVMHIDNYGNAITNITESMLRPFIRNKKFVIMFRSLDYTIEKIYDSFDDDNLGEGEMLALISTTGYLELAVNKGNASELLGLKIGSSIMVEIKPPRK